VSLCKEKEGLSLDELHAQAEKSLRSDLEGLGFDMSGNVRGHFKEDGGYRGVTNGRDNVIGDEDPVPSSCEPPYRS
jgi:hypothetical protein